MQPQRMDLQLQINSSIQSLLIIVIVLLYLHKKTYKTLQYSQDNHTQLVCLITARKLAVLMYLFVDQLSMRQLFQMILRLDLLMLVNLFQHYWFKRQQKNLMQISMPVSSSEHTLILNPLLRLRKLITFIYMTCNLVDQLKIKQQNFQVHSH